MYPPSFIHTHCRKKIPLSLSTKADIFHFHRLNEENTTAWLVLRNAYSKKLMLKCQLWARLDNGQPYSHISHASVKLLMACDRLRAI